MLPFRAIDPFVNVNPPIAEWENRAVAEELNARVFKSPVIGPGTTLEQLVEQMNAAGIEKAIIDGRTDRPRTVEFAWRAVETYPERFKASLNVDPNEGIMKTVRAIQAAFDEKRICLVRVMGLRTKLPYSHASYYPIYAKCAELGLPLGVNVGIPGPRVPAKNQDPLDLDEICYLFPELTIVMQHIGDPWVDLCVRLLLKWPNLYYMTSAFAPKHIPKQILTMMNRRPGGADKVMWASDYPFLTFDRCLQEIRDLPFESDAILYKFARGNAERLFFSEAR